MKKLISVALVLVLTLALCVPAFAAPKTYSKAELSGLVDANVPEAYRGEVQRVIAQLPESGNQVDAAKLKTAAATLQSALNNKENTPADVQAAVDAAAAAVKEATNSAVVINSPKVSLNTLNGQFTVTADVAVNGASVAVSGSATAKVPAWTDSSKKTESNTAAAAAGVIKATGFDSTTVVLVVLTIAGLLGVATVKARKMD